MGTGLGVSAYLNSRETIELMWRDLADELVEDATEKTLRYFEPGAPQLELHRAMVDEGALDIADRPALLATLLRCLRVQPAITWCSWGGADGAYLSAYRDAEDELRLTHREPVEGGTRYSDYRVRDDGTLEPLGDEVRSTYDPRTRPWWDVGTQAVRPRWAEPFLFASRRQPGVVLTLRQDDREGALLGVWLAEYELSYVGRFLRVMKEAAQARGGPFAAARVYILSEDGHVIGHPDGQTVDGEGAATRLLPARDHPDPQLRAAYAEMLEGAGPNARRHFAFGKRRTFLGMRLREAYLGVSAPFPAGGPRWTAVVTVPTDSLLGPIYANNRRAALIAALVAFLSVVVGVLLAESFVRPLKRIAHDLDRIGRLSFPDRTEAPRGFVREITDMMVALHRMTGGLRSFSRYVPADLVRELMARGQVATLGGETRELTVYFSDIAGFTGLAEKLSPQELVDVLAEYLGEMSEILRVERGTVDKYIGDAIMAFWGAPQEVRDHALSACRAALRCQARLAELRERSTDARLSAIRVRIGINSGDCLVGNIGSDERMNYTVMGDTVNVASRLEAQCARYGVGILIGERTRALAGDAIVARPVDKIAVKGKDQGVVVYELVGLAGEVDARELARVAMMERGFSEYLEGRFDDAARTLGDVLAEQHEDPAAAALLARCERYRAEPPASWDGVTRLTSK